MSGETVAQIPDPESQGPIGPVNPGYRPQLAADPISVIAPNGYNPAAVVPEVNQGDLQRNMDNFQKRHSLWSKHHVEDTLWGKMKCLVCSLLAFFAIFILYLMIRRSSD